MTTTTIEVGENEFEYFVELRLTSAEKIAVIGALQQRVEYIDAALAEAKAAGLEKSVAYWSEKLDFTQDLLDSIVATNYTIVEATR